MSNRLNASNILLGLLGVVICTSNAFAGPYVAPGPPVVAAPKFGLPTPDEVPSKEYSNRTDKGGHDRSPVAGLPHDLDPEQVIAWDGSGGTRDAVTSHILNSVSIDYTGTRPGDVQDREVDAIANKTDVLFNDVKGDSSYLLFSVGHSAAGTVGNDHIYYETPMPLGFPVGLGGPKPVADGGIWATPASIESDVAELDDVDGLEVWGFGTDDLLENVVNLPGGGFDGFNDSNRYSLEGDPDVDGAAGAPRVSVWNSGGTSYIDHSFIIAAIASLATNGDLDATEEALVDVDALMVLDFQADTSFGPLDEILFSVAPVPNTDGGPPEFDGGEIFHLVGPAASFLTHGDHIWDQAFDVSGTVAGFLGVDPNNVSENINALEAVSFFVIPEPSTLVLATVALLVLAWRRRGRKA